MWTPAALRGNPPWRAPLDRVPFHRRASCSRVHRTRGKSCAASPSLIAGGRDITPVPRIAQGVVRAWRPVRKQGSDTDSWYRARPRAERDRSSRPSQGSLLASPQNLLPSCQPACCVANVSRRRCSPLSNPLACDARRRGVIEQASGFTRLLGLRRAVPGTLVYSILSSSNLFCICFSHRLFFGEFISLCPLYLTRKLASLDR
jgi:hypothetical protein